jgi:hypothetical protein
MGIVVALAATGAQAQPAPSSTRATVVALPELRTFNLDPKLQSFFVEHLALQLKLQGLQVVTQRELETMLGVERQKALLGCNDGSTSCSAELASALGADAIVIGDIGHLGPTYQVNLKAIAGKDGKTLAAFAESTGAEDKVLELLSVAAPRLAESIFKNLGRVPPPNAALVSGSAGPRRFAWAPLAGGALLVAGGGVSFFLAGQTYSELSSGKPLTEADGRSVVARGQTQELLGMVGIGLGAAALVTGAVMYALGPSSDGAPTALVAPVPGGAAVVFSGRLP